MQQQFEHEVEIIHNSHEMDGNKIISFITSREKVGWELVAATEVNSGRNSYCVTTLYFKRPVKA